MVRAVSGVRVFASQVGHRNRKSGSHTALGGAALVAGLLLPSGVWAQCTDTFGFTGFNIPKAGEHQPVQNLLPLGTGSSLAALTATINTVNTAFLTNSSAFVSAPGGAQPDQQGAGAWARGVTGSVDTKTTSTGTIDGIITDPGKQTCHTTVRQDFSGFQVGQDISVLNEGGQGANLHFGLTAGAFETRTKDITPAGAYTSPNNGIPFITPPGSLSENSQIPFVGMYAAFTKGNLFLDAQARWDFYQNSLSDPNNGLSGQRLDARDFSLTGNVGYQFQLPNTWFIEPSAGLVYSHIIIDPLNVAGVLTQNPLPPNFPYARGVVNINDVDSLLGRVSVRIGTSFTQSNVTWQPYFTASVFSEFLGDVTATSLEQGTGNPAIDGLKLTSTSSGGVGTYGQFALGTAVVLGNSGWLGYGRADYRIGENIEGWDVTAGLRYQFGPTSAFGSIKDGPTFVGPAYNWTGAYVGALAGTTWGDVRGHFLPPDPSTAFKPDFAGTVFGGQIGYNIQSGSTVVGIEGDYAFANARGGVSCPNAFFFTCEADVDALSFVTGRIGTTWGRALLYAKGGLAVGEVEATTKQNSPSPVIVGVNPPVAIPLANPVATTDWRLGWTVGGGMEFALTNRWSAKAEYMYYDLGSAK